MKLLSWNIRGIYEKEDGIRTNKMKTKQVETLLQKADIVFLQETHLEINDTSDVFLSGYNVVHYCRQKRKNAPRASGGISIFVKEQYRQKIKFLSQNNHERAWLHIPKENVDKQEKDIYIGSAYIPPEFSSFGKDNTMRIWENFENDVDRFSEKGNVIICGDFNARSGTLSDLIVVDEIFQHYDLDNSPNERYSMDKKIDKSGRRLIEVCTENNLHILNGRTLGDLQGRYTSFQHQGCSVVDYFICSQSVLKNIMYMRVKNLTIHSDHCPLEVDINTSFILEKDKIRYIKEKNKKVITDNKPHTTKEEIAETFIWDNNAKESYKNAMQLPEIKSQIEHLNRNLSTFDKISLNTSTKSEIEITINTYTQKYFQSINDI